MARVTVTPSVEFFFNQHGPDGRRSTVYSCPKKGRAVPRRAYGYITFDLRQISLQDGGMVITVSERLKESPMHYIGQLHTYQCISRMKSAPQMMLGTMKMFGINQALRSPDGSWRIVDQDDVVVSPKSSRATIVR